MACPKLLGVCQAVSPCVNCYILFMVPENKHRVFVFGGKNPPCIGYVNKAISDSFLSVGLRPNLDGGALVLLFSSRRQAGKWALFTCLLVVAWGRATDLKSPN